MSGVVTNLMAVPILRGWQPAAHVECGGWRELVLIGWNGRASIYFLALAATCAVGTVGLSFIRTMSNEAEATATEGADWRTTLRLLTSPLVRDMLLWIMYTGCSATFLSGLITHQMGVENVGPASAAASFAAIGAPLLVGMFIDRAGLRWAAASILLINGGALVFTLLVNDSPSTLGWVCALSALTFADTGGSTVLAASCARRFAPPEEDAVPGAQQRAAAEASGTSSTSARSRAETTRPLLAKEVPATESYTSVDMFSLMGSLSGVVVSVGFLLSPLVLPHGSNAWSDAQFATSLGLLGGLEFVALAIFVWAAPR